MELRKISHGKKMVGVVVRDKMEKTVVIEVEKYSKHAKYGKYLRTKKRYKAHDEANGCKVGDRVQIVETRPLSKEKHWLVKEVLKTEVFALAPEEVGQNDTGEN
jgi:small subunit ribosomal protein S17